MNKMCRDLKLNSDDRIDETRFYVNGPTVVYFYNTEVINSYCEDFYLELTNYNYKIDLEDLTITINI